MPRTTAPKVVRVTYSSPRAQKTASAQVDPTYFDYIDSEDVGRVRPECLCGVRPQEEDHQRAVKQIIVPSVGVPVLHMVEQLVGAVREPVPLPQMVEQLVDGDAEVELYTLLCSRDKVWKERGLGDDTEFFIIKGSGWRV